MSPAAAPAQSQLDPALQHFTDPSFDPADFLNNSLPPLTLSSSQPHATRAPAAVPLTDLSSRIQSLLSQVGSQSVRLSNILTQITDEILRSGGRLAYEVEVLRGESVALSDALSESLSADIAKFAPRLASTPESAREDATKKAMTKETAKATEEATDEDAAAAVPVDPEDDEENNTTVEENATMEPLFITQLRTLSKVRARLEEVVQTFGDAMEWPLPPSELSLTSSFISVSAPEPGSESYSREERGQEVAKKVRTEIAELLDSRGGGENGLAAATERLQALRTLGQVWKGTSEEKARNRFLDSLAKIIEDRRKALDGQRDRAAKKGRIPTTQAADESANNDTGGPGGGLFRNLQHTGPDPLQGNATPSLRKQLLTGMFSLRNTLRNTLRDTLKLPSLVTLRSLFLSRIPCKHSLRRASVVGPFFLVTAAQENVHSFHRPVFAPINHVPVHTASAQSLSSLSQQFTMVQIDWEAQQVVVGHARSLWKKTTSRISIPPRLRPSRIVSNAIAVSLLFLGLIVFAFIKRGSIITTPGISRDSAAAATTPPFQDGGLPDDFNFHILVAAQPKNAALCRTITSAMINDYPSLTLLKQRPEIAAKPKTKTSTLGETRIEKIKSILTFLTTNGRVYDHDLVLIVDSDDTLFQLPPDILIQRYKDLHKRNNDRLKRKYGTKFIGDGNNLQEVPKYTQKVLFAASKDCSSNITDSIACASVPQSPLPPDIYGATTDKKRDGTRNRPRWLDSGVVMGKVCDLIPLYEKVLENMKKQPLHANDQLVLTQLFGNQEYSREVERRRSTSLFKEWLWDAVGIADYSNITNVRARIQPGDWHEFGMGLDYEGQLFLNAGKTAGDIEWLKYRDVRKVSLVQIQHGVPREVRLNLPLDIEQSSLNPFKQVKSTGTQVVKPPLNTSIDVLPPSWNFTWNDIPLATYIQTAAVPAIVHTNGDQALRQEYWHTAWFHPWARALLRRHVRSATKPETQVVSALGASDVLRDPGRKGGMWTDNDQWMSFAELCSGHEEAVFGDGLGPWGNETPNTRPVYNLWGKLMAGKGPKYKKLGEMRTEAEEIERLELGIDDDDDEE